MHHGVFIAQRLRQINVLHLRCGQRDLRLQIATPDDWASAVQDGLASPRLGGAWIAASGRVMPVTSKVGVVLHLKAIITFGVQRDSLRICVLEILDQVDYRVYVRRPWILREVGALIRCIVDVGSGALIQEFDLSH